MILFMLFYIIIYFIYLNFFVFGPIYFLLIILNKKSHFKLKKEYLLVGNKINYTKNKIFSLQFVVVFN